MKFRAFLFMLGVVQGKERIPVGRLKESIEALTRRIDAIESRLTRLETCPCVDQIKNEVYGQG